MYDTNSVNAVTRAMRSEVSDHVTASEKKSLREVRDFRILTFTHITSQCLKISDLMDTNFPYLPFLSRYQKCFGTTCRENLLIVKFLFGIFGVKLMQIGMKPSICLDFSPPRGELHSYHSQSSDSVICWATTR